MARGDNEKANIEWTLKVLKVKYEKEYLGLKPRKFRFDFAIPEHKIAIEYEGLRSAKSRHTTFTGFSEDTVKYNLATVRGWRVLRYTAKTYQNLRPDLEILLGL